MKEFILDYGKNAFFIFPSFLVIVSSYFLYVREEIENGRFIKYMSYIIYSFFFSLILMPLFRLLKEDNAKIWVVFGCFLINSFFLYLSIKYYRKNRIKGGKNN